MFRSKQLSVLTLCFLSCAVGPISAGEFYLSAGAGYVSRRGTEYRFDPPRFNFVRKAEDASFAPVVTVGYAPVRWLGLEASYLYAGSTTVTSVFGTPPAPPGSFVPQVVTTLPFKNSTHCLLLAPRVNFTPWKHWTLSATAGVNVVFNSANLRAAFPNFYEPVSTIRASPYAGFGVSYSITRQFDVSVDYRYLDLRGDSLNRVADFFAVSAKLRF